MNVLQYLFRLALQFLVVALVVALIFAVLFALLIVFKMWQKNWSISEAIAQLKKTYAETKAEIAQRRGVNAAPRAGKRYKKRSSVMSPAEKEFFAALELAVPEAPIFPKVRVADVIEANERWSGDFLRISQKHFDWVLCHPTSFEPLMAIELDDQSHRARKNAANDATKDNVASDAGLPLMRFQWADKYDAAAIRERITTVINSL